MSAHVLLNLLNKLRKRDQIPSLPSILSLFPFELNKFNNAGAQMLDSIYLMAFKLVKNHFFDMKTSIFCHVLHVCNVKMDISM